MASEDEDSFAIISTSPPSNTEKFSQESISSVAPSPLIQRRRESNEAAAAPVKIIRTGTQPYRVTEDEGSSWGHIESLGSSVRFDPSLKVLSPALVHHLEKDLQDLQEEAIEDGTVTKSIDSEGAMEDHPGSAGNLAVSYELVPSPQSQSITSQTQVDIARVDGEDGYKLPCECLRNLKPVYRQYSIDPEVYNYLEEGRHQRCRRRFDFFSSDTILKWLTVIIGLWNPGKGFRIVFTVLSVLISMYVVIGFAYTSWICIHFNKTPLDVLYCPDEANGTQASTRTSLLVDYMAQFFELEINIIQVISYLTLFISLFRIKRSEHTFSFLEYTRLVSRKDWLLLNLQVLITFAVIVFVNFDDKEDKLRGYKPSKYTYFLMYPAATLMWVNLASGCWIFAIIACALVRITECCHANIRGMKDGDLDDVIDIHQHLCDHVISTVGILKYWFLAHWFFFVLLTVGGISLLVLHAENPQSSRFSVGTLALVLYALLSPCVYATKVTDSCKGIVATLNRSRSRDWRKTHPFYSRAKLNLFLEYAERAQCGFRIGDVVFGKNFAWLSLFIAMCGLAVKVLGG